MSLSKELKKGGSRHATSRVRSVSGQGTAKCGVRGIVEGEPLSMLEGRQGDQGSLGKGTQGSQTRRGSQGKLVSAWGFADADPSVDPGFRCEWKRNPWSSQERTNMTSAIKRWLWLSMGWPLPSSLPPLNTSQPQQGQIQSTYRPCNFTVLGVIPGLPSTSPMGL